MSSAVLSVTEDVGRIEVWRATGDLREILPQGTTTDSPKLQQLWIDAASGKTKWRNVPRVVVPNAEFFCS